MKPIHSMLIRWSTEDGCYVVYLPEFGCYGGHGDTYEQAAASGREAIESLSDGGALPVPPPHLVGGGQTIAPPAHEAGPLAPDWYEQAMKQLNAGADKPLQATNPPQRRAVG